jgi:hypothetical protein
MYKVRTISCADLVIVVVTSLHLGASTEGADKLSEEDKNIVTEHTGLPALRRETQGSWLIGLTGVVFILLQTAPSVHVLR